MCRKIKIIIIRLFGILEKVKEQFELNLVEEVMSPVASNSRQEFVSIWRSYNHLMDEINNVNQSLGKDGKFQLFICLSLR